MMARCKEMIYSGFSAHQCSRNATVDGYCKQHHPDAVQARQEASRARADVKYQNSPMRRLMNSNADLKELLAEALVYVQAGASFTDSTSLTRRIKEAIK